MERPFFLVSHLRHRSFSADMFQRMLIRTYSRVLNHVCNPIGHSPWFGNVRDPRLIYVDSDVQKRGWNHLRYSFQKKKGMIV